MPFRIHRYVLLSSTSRRGRQNREGPPRRHEGAEAGVAAVEERIDLIGVMQDSGNGFTYLTLVQPATVHKIVRECLRQSIAVRIAMVSMISRTF